MTNKNVSKFELPNITDDLGRIYLLILFITGVIWAFIAINNFDTPNIFKLALIYSLLLIFGFLGIIYDRSAQKLGIDSRIWEGSKLKFQLGIGILFFFLWYIVFIRSGFSVASAQSVSGTFAVSPTFNFVLVNILGPLAEDIFFFGVLNITLVFFIRTILDNKKKSLIVAGLIAASIPLFTSVPNSLYFLIAASGITALASFMSKNKLINQHAPIIISALVIGAVVFPKFHSYAYQLNERHYVAATYFGFAVCLIASYVGLLPVDLAHSANNIIATSG